jgi:hypothetical protein
MDITVIFDVILLFLGLYIMMTSVRMKKDGQVSTLFVTREELSRCRDMAGFVTYLYPRAMVFGVVSILFGIQGLYNDLVQAMAGWVNGLMVVLFLAAWGWFSVSLRKGKEKYL